MFQLSIDRKIYSQLNKNGALKKYFKSDSVGKCIQLIDDCARSVDDFNERVWIDYYYNKRGTERLSEITDAITELTNIDRDIIKQYVFHRVLGQTYNGFITEINILQELQNEFNRLVFAKTDYDIDEKYFTDFEAFYNGELVFGGQIKPISYKMMNKPSQQASIEYHNKQREAYKDKFKVPHILVYYDPKNNSELHEKELVFNQINLILIRNII